jgi:tRNA(fMet)-specific endonuclease VapC
MISASELWLGTEKSDRREERQRQLGDFLSVFEPLVFDADSARAYGQIRAYLERQGLSIGPLDLLIAAHARSQGAILLTANIREFRRVPGLKCQVWPIDARG